MVQEDVLLPDRIDPLRRRREERARTGQKIRILEIGTLEAEERQKIRRAERTVDFVQILRVELELTPEQVPHRVRATLVHLEADGRAKTPLPHVLRDAAEQVAGLFLPD